ncbi:MAG: LysR family glycine cleavage system transcriptional activator [Alphaproteobacteria bacterium]|jgi:LysR family glycine cleavage system transcriptional activator
MQKSYLPPLKALHYFLVAAQRSSFKLAAQELNVTQAAISQQIKVLEAYFGFPLFIRLTRQTMLSEQGRKLLPFIDQGFAQLYAGVKQLSGDLNATILRISAINSFTSIWILPRLHTFQAAHPEIMVQIAPSNDLVDFNKGDIDLAIRMGQGQYKGLLSKPVLQDEMLLVASPSVIDKKDILNPQKIFTLPLIEDTSADVRQIFEMLCTQHEVSSASLVPVIRADNSVTIIENVMQGRGFSLVNRSLVLEHIASGKLLSLLNFSHKSPFSLYLVAPEHHFKWEKVKAFERWFVPLIGEYF